MDANYRSNGQLDKLLIVQASIHEMPFKVESFDKIFCFGVLQHTPDPAKSFACLAGILKPGGEIAVDVYRRFPWWKQVCFTKYWVRPVTKRLPSALLYALCRVWVRFWWPVTGLFRRLTGKRWLSWAVSIADYRGVYPLPPDLQKEWAILDTFDMLSPTYDLPQNMESVRSWFEGAGLRVIDLRYGYNGICGIGRRA